MRRLLVATAIYLLAALPGVAEKRVALLIGNAGYDRVADLANPHHDAADLGVALQDIGFDVQVETDLSLQAMQRVLRDFQRKADGADISVIYYAGHGIEVNNTNYLIPTDAGLQTDRDIAFEAMPLANALLAGEGAARLSLVIVDACRDNPFMAQMTRTSASRSIGRGLAKVEPVGNTLVAYAAKGGTTAADGLGRNSPYAKALLASLAEPRLEVGMMFRQVRDRVLQATGGNQEPFVYGSLSAEALFLNDSAAPVAVQAGDQVEVVLWNSIAASTDVRDFEEFLRRYPDGQFAGFAARRVEQLGAQDGASPSRLLKPVNLNEQVEVASAGGDVPEVAPKPLSRQEIRLMQEYLTILKHRPGPIDGLMGKRTAAAITAYEASKGLPGTGQPTDRVLALLRGDVGDGELDAFRAARARAIAQRRAAAAQQAAAAPAEEDDDDGNDDDGDDIKDFFEDLFKPRPANGAAADDDDDD